ncbi:MAG TPA: hypothetical protein VM370_12555 [Candidatus Thermoplasmatota archaeon]|nr:hypothetical protein [Candidatus Thermoplasmatota archaeon]
MHQPRSALRMLAALSAATLVGAVLAATLIAPAAATHQPANKMAASGASLDIGAPGETLDILSGTLRTSGPEDLVISLTMECDILTQVNTVGNDLSHAEAHIVAWVEIDGAPVGVTDGDDGRVVFCDRVHEQETSLFDDENATIRSFIQTRTANAFNWLALNVGSGVHTVVARAELTSETDGDDLTLANAVIGKRTLLVDPTKLANDASM